VEHLVGRNTNEMRIMAFQDWRVICPPLSDAQGRCALNEDVARDQGGALVSLALNNSALGSGMSVTVPHGVLLAPGLGFAPGNEPIRAHPYETCNPNGCIALVPVDAAMLKSLKESATGQVVVVPSTGSPATIPFSLKGFAEGYAQLELEEARRGSPWGFLLR
jgi:invasion protein IalB